MSLTAEQYRNLYASEGKKLVEETVDAKYKEFQKDFNEKTIPFTTGFATSMAIMAGQVREGNRERVHRRRPEGCI